MAKAPKRLGAAAAKKAAKVKKPHPEAMAPWTAPNKPRRGRHSNLNDPDGMTPMQRAFAEAFVANGGNGAKAAIAAGYEGTSPGACSNRIRAKAHVQDFIRREAKRRSQESELSHTWILKRLMRHADFDVRKLYHEDGRLKKPQELDDDTARSVLSLEVATTGDAEGAKINTTKVRRVDPIKPLEMLGKWLRMWDDARPLPPTVQDQAETTITTITTDDPIEAARAYQRLVNGN